MIAVVAHGEADPSDRALVARAERIVAADGGARALAGWGLEPHAVVGDLDSLPDGDAASYERRGVRVIRHGTAKDETDTELALAYALGLDAARTTERAPAAEVVLVGLFGGGRLDHCVANALLLADPRWRGHDVRAVRGGTTMRALFGGDRLVLAGARGDLVSLVPASGDARGVRTEGLRYALDGEVLRSGAARGVSNIVERAPAAVTLADGILIVFEISRGGAM